MTPELEQELQGTPELSVMKRQQQTYRGLNLYPKPELSDIEALWTDLQPLFAQYQIRVNQNRDIRYGRDETPEKWKRAMQDARRFRSGLSNNEVLRVSAMIDRNKPKFKVPPAGSNPKAINRGTKQTRWLNQLVGSIDRNPQRPIFRRVIDAMAGDGMGVLEFFVNDDKHNLVDTEPQEILDPKTGEMRTETPKEVVARTEEQLIQAGLPFGARHVDPIAIVYEEDNEGRICRAIIAEMKPYRNVFNSLPQGKREDARLPRPGTPGWPQAASTSTTVNQTTSGLLASIGASQSNGNCLTLRYYDAKWYAYIVGGILVEGPEAHGLPGVPLFVGLGMTTGSPNRHEMIQGVAWPMANMEVFVNDAMSLALDSYFSNSRARIAIKTTGASSPAGKEPPSVVDLSDPNKAPRLRPGEEPVNAAAGFQPLMPEQLIQQVMSFYQRAGLNAIAQGESPGADPAGYTVNSLMGAAQSQYEILCDNYASMLGNFADYCRLYIRDSYQDIVYLSVPMADHKVGGTEWLGLGPEDVDETPCVVTIDPLSDANRLALRQSLITGMKEGLVPRREVQSTGYGADDPEQWSDEMILDTIESSLESMLIEEVMQDVRMAQAATQPPPGGSGLVDQNGNPLSSGNLPPETAPAATQPPTVGRALTQASRGGGGLNASRANAGQGNSYVPPQGVGGPA